MLGSRKGTSAEYTGVGGLGLRIPFGERLVGDEADGREVDRVMGAFEKGESALSSQRVVVEGRDEDGLGRNWGDAGKNLPGPSEVSDAAGLRVTYSGDLAGTCGVIERCLAFRNSGEGECSYGRVVDGREGCCKEYERVRSFFTSGSGSGETFFQPCSRSDGGVFHLGVGATSAGGGGSFNGVEGRESRFGVEGRERRDPSRRRKNGVGGGDDV